LVANEIVCPGKFCWINAVICCGNWAGTTGLSVQPVINKTKAKMPERINFFISIAIDNM
jgi:hypothetical protein